MTSFCKYCDQQIRWVENREGKWVATDAQEVVYDPYDPQWHRCTGRNKEDWVSERKYCYNCDREIYFSSDNKSPSGKYIPMDAETDNPHKCE